MAGKPLFAQHSMKGAVVVRVPQQIGDGAHRQGALVPRAGHWTQGKGARSPRSPSLPPSNGAGATAPQAFHMPYVFLCPIYRDLVEHFVPLCHTQGWHRPDTPRPVARRRDQRTFFSGDPPPPQMKRRHTVVFVLGYLQKQGARAPGSRSNHQFPRCRVAMLLAHAAAVRTLSNLTQALPLV